MKKGFTLAEVLFTVVILAILAGIAVPGFSKSIDKSAAKQAVAYLRVIGTAQKMYFAKNNEYACQTANPCNSKGTITAVLGAEVSEEHYAFYVNGTATTFTASAKKGSASTQNCDDTDTICLDQSGTWTSTSSYEPASQLNS